MHQVEQRTFLPHMRIDQLPFPHDYFWSYRPDADLPEEIVAEKILVYGDISAIVQLEKLLGRDRLAGTWKKRLAGRRQYAKLNALLEVLYG
jgi:hypothetical protein